MMTSGTYFLRLGASFVMKLDHPPAVKGVLFITADSGEAADSVVDVESSADGVTYTTVTSPITLHPGMTDKVDFPVQAAPGDVNLFTKITVTGAAVHIQWAIVDTNVVHNWVSDTL